MSVIITNHMRFVLPGGYIKCDAISWHFVSFYCYFKWQNIARFFWHVIVCCDFMHISIATHHVLSWSPSLRACSHNGHRIHLQFCIEIRILLISMGNLCVSEQTGKKIHIQIVWIGSAPKSAPLGWLVKKSASKSASKTVSKSAPTI